jgi:hypothetical protein
LLIGANRLHQYLCLHVPGIACIPLWPLSLVMPRVPPEIGYPNASHIATGAASLALFVLALAALQRARYSPVLSTLFGLALILSTTLTHGWQFGLVRASAGVGNMPQDYFQDALRVVSPAQLLREFTDIQPSLAIHSRTHPPGAILAFYLLRQLLHDPAVITIAIAALSSVLTALVLGRLLKEELRGEEIGRVLFLFFLIPSVQIYYAASLDALIAPLVVGSCLALFGRSPGMWVAASTSLLLASSLSFGVLFILPVILAFELLSMRRPWRTIFLAGSLAAFYGLLWAVFQFNYLRSFAIATHLENPEGFRLLADTADYLMTRVEDIAEIFIFLGPFLSLILLSRLRASWAASALPRLSLLAAGGFLLLLLTGAYRTGETARAALFMVPFLILPVAGFVAALPDRQYRLLATLLFLQALIMQLAGDYWW